MKDLNAIDLEGAMRQIEGTARNMGIVVEDVADCGRAASQATRPDHREQI